MQTEVVMKRELLGKTIRQRSKSEYLSGTDLVAIGNKWRSDNGFSEFNMSVWLKTSGTKEFIAELQKGCEEKVVIIGRGRSGGTWMHPLLFIDMALAIHPKLKVEMYSWLKDSLLADRNNSGDSYKLMTGSLYLNHHNKALFGKYIAGVAKKIREHCGVGEGKDDWQNVDAAQLKERDTVQTMISRIAANTRDNDTAVRMALGQLSTKTN